MKGVQVYQILMAYDIETIEQKVNDAFHKGWKLYEALHVIKTKHPQFKTEYYQVMVKSSDVLVKR